MTDTIPDANFHLAIIDSIPDLAIVISENGGIEYTNNSWREHGRKRGLCSENTWQDANYLEVCDTATLTGNQYSQDAALGIRQTIRGDRSNFSLEYPCDAPDQKQWYQMRIHPVQRVSTPSYLILHQDITDTRKHIEHLQALMLTDSLTGIGNRRYFDDALNAEWRRDMRTGAPVSLLLLDIDDFKLFNDQNGHLAGDRVLKQVANTVQQHARRPGDWACRYGGEELALILARTGSDAAIKIARRLLQSIRNLTIKHASASSRDFVSVSIGVATMYPIQGLSEEAIIAAADQKMYRAKYDGGDSFMA